MFLDDVSLGNHVHDISNETALRPLSMGGSSTLNKVPHMKKDDMAIHEHFEPGPQARPGPAPGPPANLNGHAWAVILKPAKIFLARARPEMLFLVVLHYKTHWRPAQARARPEPGPKIEARCVQWDGHEHDFFGSK
jgi:hypothetical protein